MAVYGITFFGSGTYGETAATQLRASNFTARAENYDSLFLSWENPAGTYDNLVLSRSSYGHPATPGEGTILFTDPKDTARTSYTDGAPYPVSPGPLTPGRFYYYTLFVYTETGNTYQAVGYALALVTYPHGSGERLWDLLPEIHKEMDFQQQLVGGEGPLKRFLALFGYQLDSVRTEIDTLLNAYTIDLVSGNLLPVLAKSFGIAYEPELGQRRSRIILKNTVYMAKMKGTKPGIEAVVSSYTGWGATAVIGPNRLLNYNDSGQLEGLGNWVVTGADVDWQDAATFSGPVVNYGSIKLTATGTADMVATLGTVAGQSLIPVKPSTEYTASIYTMTDVTARSVRLDIVWYTAAGAVVSTTAGTASNNTTSWDRRTATATSPAMAAYAQLVVTVITPGGAGEVHRLGAAQLEAGGSATTWQSGRQINIYLDPERRNLVPNPSIEVDTTGWAAGADTAITRSNTKAVTGTWALRLNRSSGTGVAQATTPTGAGGMAVLANTYYTASASVLAGTTVRDVRVGLNFYTSGGALIGSTTYGTAITDHATDAVRPYVTVLSPSNAAYAAIVLEADGVVASTEYHYFDGMMLEQTESLQEYFDASFLPLGDYVWSGSAHASASNYYPRRDIKDYRLRTVLPEYTPDGLTVGTFYGSIAPATSV